MHQIALQTLLDSRRTNGYAGLVHTIRAELANGHSYVFTDLEGKASHKFDSVEQFTRWLNRFEGQTLMSDLQDLGIRIAGRDDLLASLVSANNWREEFALQASMGFGQGIYLSADPEGFASLVPRMMATLDGHGFDKKQAHTVQDNVRLDEPS